MRTFDPDRKYMAFDAAKRPVDDLANQLETMTYWQPASALLDVVRHKQRLLADTRVRFESRPVITVVGPTGSGKSTLVNVLADAGILVEMGNKRPTTRAVTVICRYESDAQQLTERIGVSDIRVISSFETAFPDALLVDTPDTDSGECMRHRPLLQQALQLTDILVCVFDASNPKRRDNIKALEDWVTTFPGDQIIPVLNRCDRIPQDELESSVIPDFKKHLAESWARSYDTMFCVSARDALSDPEWPDGEHPLHDINQLPDLRRHLQKTGSGAFFVDRRIERARHIHSMTVSLVRETARHSSHELISVQTDIRKLEHDIISEGLKVISARTGDDGAGLASLLCGAMAQRWWGPVGLFVGFWRRLVDFRTPFSFVRSLSPASLISGLARSVRALGNPKGFETHLKGLLNETLTNSESLDVKLKIVDTWPDIADRLVEAGFSSSIRSSGKMFDLTPLLQLSRNAWRTALDDAVEKTADRLSHPCLQWILNAPVLIGTGAVAWNLLRGFIGHAFLPASFLLHSGILLLILWLFPSWFLQWLTVRSRKKLILTARTFALKTLQNSAPRNSTDSSTPADEIAQVLRLADLEIDRTQ